jgi:hypothetical protein
MKRHMRTAKARRDTAVGQSGTDDTHLKERLRRMAVQRSTVVRNGRFFFSAELNTLTYWYEDRTQSTRMVYIE